MMRINLIKTIILFIFITVLSITQVYATEDWTDTELMMLGFIGALQAVDVVQTQYATCGGGCVEDDFFTKRITGDRAAWYETTPIKIVVLVPLYYIVKEISSTYRPFALGIVMFISIYPVLNNTKLVVKF